MHQIRGKQGTRPHPQARPICTISQLVCRFALNLKSAAYSTNWVELPDVAKTRKDLGVPASRKFPDGTDFYTLPVLFDRSTKQYVGDSFEIALYLDHKYPDGPRLISPGTVGVTKAWNDRVDQFFSRFVQLFSHGMPLNPANIEESRKGLVHRGQSFVGKDIIKSWDDCGVTGDKRTQMWAEFKAALSELESYYNYDGGHDRQAKSTGPFLDGERPTYADLIVGGWLGMAHATLSSDEWADFQSWHDGRWGKIWQKLEPYTSMG